VSIPSTRRPYTSSRECMAGRGAWQCGPPHLQLSPQPCRMWLNLHPVSRYLQMTVDGKNVNRSLPDSVDPSSVSLEQAVEMLRGPMVLGQHEETELDITLQNGRFGPYYIHGSLQCSVGKLEEDQEPNLEHALAKLEKKANRAGEALCCVCAVMVQCACMRGTSNS
jgi:hypothetical protein